MARQIIRGRDLRKLIPFSSTTFWRLERADKFPKRVQLTEGGAVGWYLDEIEQWMQQRIRAGGKTPPGRKGAIPDIDTSAGTTTRPAVPASEAI